MQTTPSFASLAERLAAQAASIRPVDGARDNLAKFVALVLCALMDMLIYVCAMLDARAAAEICFVAPGVPRDGIVASFRALSLALPGERRVRPPEIRLVASKPAFAPFMTGETTPAGPWLVQPCGPGRLRANLARPWWPVENAAFPPTPTHVDFIAIS